MSDSLNPAHSWPGISISAKFTGTSIGVRMDDSSNYYNVYIDGKFQSIFHGNKVGVTDYLLVDGLKNKKHIFRFSQRNFTFDKVFTFSGLLIDDGAHLESLPPFSNRKIEFIGDSFTAAEGNEATELEMVWEKKFPVTNIDEGFATITARHFKTDYHIICRSGIGVVCDWQGNHDFAMPKFYDRALMEKSEPKWDFSKWIPNLVVITLGFNDHSGLKGKDSVVSDSNSVLYYNKYREFISTIRKYYSGVKIIAFAAYPEWIRTNVRKVVAAEKAGGHNDIYYAQFDDFKGGYVANGHPSVKTHYKIAKQLIKAIDSFRIFQRD
jgi:hypothetical protein